MVFGMLFLVRNTIDTHIYIHIYLIAKTAVHAIVCLHGVARTSML